MNIELPAAELTPDRVEVYIGIANDKDNQRAAVRVLTELKRLAGMVEVADIYRCVIDRDDAVGALNSLADHLSSRLSRLMGERSRANDVLRADDGPRRSLDLAAFEVMVAAESDAKQHLAAAASTDSAATSVRASLGGAGLTADEIDQVIIQRRTAGEPLATGSRDAAATATARSIALAAYLADPLRRRDQLDEGLLSDLVERSGSIAQRPAMAAAATQRQLRDMLPKYSPVLRDRHAQSA